MTAARDIGPMIDKFEATARKAGLTRVCESRTYGNLAKWLGTVRAKARRPVPAKP
jgi:hypothetical protein